MPVPHRSTELALPRHRSEHPTHWLISTQVDCDPDGVPVPLSVVVQGLYENGEWGDVLGTLDCQKTFESDVEAVDLRAGDAAVLARAVHRPRPVPENEKRMAFVLFFSELNPTS